MRLLDSLGAASTSGAVVTDRSAATIPTVTACVGFLGDMLGMLPLKLYRPTADGRQEVDDHPASRLVSSATGTHQTPFEQRQQVQVGVGFGGNGYLRVWRDSHYRPAELQWLRPVDVRPELVRTRDGRHHARYILDGISDPLSRADIVHVRDISLDGLVGMSPIRALRESIGLSLTQREQAGRIYANGARFPGYLTAPQSLSKQQIDDAREEWRRHHVGTENAGKNPILWGGWDYRATNGMSLADAEFLESRKFERTEIATLYRIPEVLLGNSEKTSSWGTGIETLTNGFLAFRLNPWLRNWEDALGFTLLSEDEKRQGFYFEFMREAMLQIALEQKAKFFREMRDIGVLSVNEVRRKLNLNDLPDHIGDDYGLPFNGSGGRAAVPAKTDTQPAAAE